MSRSRFATSKLPSPMPSSAQAAPNAKPRAIILLGSRGRSGINITDNSITGRRAVNAKKADLVPQVAAAWVLMRRKPGRAVRSPLSKSGWNITAPTASHPASNSSEGRIRS